MRRLRLEWLAVPTLLVLGLFGVHGREILSGFNVVPGDTGDGRIMAFLLETGWRALRGDGAFMSPPMFFPEPGTRAYTDAHLLWLPVYGALRGLGLDAFQAMSAQFVVLLTGGYLATWLLLQRVLRVGDAAAAVGAFMFVFGNALTGKLGHGQMVGVVVLPVILLLLHAAWRRASAWPAVLAGVLTGLLAATSYIVAWFFLFIAAIALVVGAIAHPPLRSALRRGLGARLLAGCGVGLAAGLVPFLWIYWAQILHGPRRDAGAPNFYRPLFSDLFNLGVDHPVWGGFLKLFGVPVMVNSTMVERAMGASPPIWVLAVAGFVLLWHQRRLLSAERLAWLWACGGVAIATALQFRYFPHGFAWQVVFHTVPGAAAIRTTFRSALVSMLVLGGVVAVALDSFARPPRPLTVRLVAVLLGVAVVVEGFWVHPPYGLDARDEARFVAKAPVPPEDCRVFALAPQVPGSRLWFVLQSDALMLSLHWRIPTMNGNSSWTPPGWDMQDPQAPGYALGVAGWVRAHGLGEATCLYDVAKNRFLPPGETRALLAL